MADEVNAKVSLTEPIIYTNTCMYSSLAGYVVKVVGGHMYLLRDNAGSSPIWEKVQEDSNQ